MSIFLDKLLITTYCDEAGDNDVPNVPSPRDLDSKKLIGSC